jgi:hypothetical protein
MSSMFKKLVQVSFAVAAVALVAQEAEAGRRPNAGAGLRPPTIQRPFRTFPLPGGGGNVTVPPSTPTATTNGNGRVGAAPAATQSVVTNGISPRTSSLFGSFSRPTRGLR